MRNVFLKSRRDRVESENNVILRSPVAPSRARSVFSVTSDDVASILESTLNNPAEVARSTALSVPAVVTARNLIAGGIAQLPLDLYTADHSEAAQDFSKLYVQPEAQYVRNVSLSYLVEDLLLHGVAYWEITELAWHGYPTTVRRLMPEWIQTLPEDKTRVIVSEPCKDTRTLSTNSLIIFHSPNPALLCAGASAIRNLKALDAAALQAASASPPMDYIQPTGDYNPDTDEVTNLLNSWKSARANNRTAFVPSGYTYNGTPVDADKAQLQEARNYGVLELARLTGISPEDLGIAVTSRSYSNIESDRRYFVTNVLTPYMLAIEQRLSLNDVCPRGYFAKFDTAGYLRADTLTRYQAHAEAIQIGLYDVAYARQLEDLPAEGGSTE